MDLAPTTLQEGTMFRENFEAQLKELHQDIIQMGTYVNKAIKSAVQAYKDHDLELCKKIITGDGKVNDLEKKIESKCIWLIAKEQPIASDLRSITTALKIITDMERIGDHAVDIAELAMDIPEKSTFAGYEKVTEMADAAIAMVSNALEAYVNTDLNLAAKADGDDDVVDEYFEVIKKEITHLLRTDNETDLDSALDVMLIAKYIERIADHAVNICEWVLFSKTGEHREVRVF